LDKRLDYIDISKGLVIIMVLIGHLNFPMWLINLIYFFHMPFFVIISGYLHRDLNFQSILIYSRKILSSYFFYGLFFIGISILLGISSSKDIINLILAQPSGIWSINFFGIFWFLIALLVIKWITYFFKPSRYSVLMAFLLFLIIPHFNIHFEWMVNLPLALFQGLTLLLFYYLGFYINFYKWNVRMVLVISFFIFIIISFYLIYEFNGFEVKIVNYHLLKVNQPILNLVLAISGSLMLLTSSKILENFKFWGINFIRFLGKYSFVFYAIHLFIFYLVKHFLKLIHLGSNQYLILAFSILVISIYINIGNKWIKNSKLKKIILFQ
jgi:acyltransferase